MRIAKEGTHIHAVEDLLALLLLWTTIRPNSRIDDLTIRHRPHGLCGESRIAALTIIK